MILDQCTYTKHAIYSKDAIACQMLSLFDVSDALRYATQQSVRSNLSVTVDAFNDVVNSECLFAMVSEHGVF